MMLEGGGSLSLPLQPAIVVTLVSPTRNFSAAIWADAIVETQNINAAG
jgi:hypothetical protein